MNEMRKGRRIFKDSSGNRNVVDWEIYKDELLMQFYDENGEPFDWKMLRHTNQDSTYDLTAIIENPTFTMGFEEVCGYCIYESMTLQEWRRLIHDYRCGSFPDSLRSPLEDVKNDIMRMEDNQDRSPVPIFDKRGRWLEEPALR